MATKFLGAASALILALAIGGAAAAQSANNTGQNGAATATAISVPGGNNNSIGNGNDNSNQGNDNAQLNGNSVLSGDAWKSNNTRLSDSRNDNSNQHNDYSDNSGQDNSRNITARVNVTSQTLASTVSGVTFNAGDSGSRTTDNRAITSGALSYSGGAFQNASGIMTTTNNTGFASNNLAATAVSANANVSFGGGNGGSQ
jgi:hypothetical protein